ncbi:MAG TPA: hypothetical protein VKW78_10925 [Terriglobales bacterium]|nr:hypothetical protein [Terriglobales bacterium]
MKRIATLLAIPVLLLGMAWARDIQLTPGTVDPGAQGKVNINTQKDETQQVKLDIQHLAMASALTPPKMGYVVWIQPTDAPEHPAENHGVLNIGNKMQGSFQTTTAYPRYNVFVTAEDNLHATQPSGPEVFRASVTPQ